MPLTVAIIGRPNVGKSTLFNKLIKKRTAIVADTPGVTRDRREGNAKIDDHDFTFIDTAGLETAEKSTIEARMRQQTQRAVKSADLSLFMIDARVGLTPIDRHFAKWVRRQEIPVLVIANKCEGNAGEAGRLECFSLGLGDPISISAEHGQGLTELCEALIEFDYKTARVLLTGPEIGITRDAITNQVAWQGKRIRLVDTAGMRRQAKLNDKVEKLSVQSSLRAVQYAEAVALILDSNAILEKQDLTIARKVVEEGRALIIAVNKWDLAKNHDDSLKKLFYRLQTSLPQVKGLPILTCSAKTGQGMSRLIPAVYELYEIWNARVPTGELNRWFEMMLETHPPPVITGRRLKLKYITQVKTRPPTFSIFSSRAEKIPESYIRYLANGLREDFGLTGVPLRINARSRSNPYNTKHK